MKIRRTMAFWIAPIAGAITGFSTFFPLGNHWLECTYEAAIGAATYSSLAACIAIVALLILDRVLRKKLAHKAVSFALIPFISGCTAALTFLPSGELWMLCADYSQVHIATAWSFIGIATALATMLTLDRALNRDIFD